MVTVDERLPRHCRTLSEAPVSKRHENLPQAASEKNENQSMKGRAILPYCR